MVRSDLIPNLIPGCRPDLIRDHDPAHLHPGSLAVCTPEC